MKPHFKLLKSTQFPNKWKVFVREGDCWIFLHYTKD